MENKLQLSDFCDYISDYDLILLSETWADKHCNLDLKGYDCFSKHRERKKNSKSSSGGLVCYIRKNISSGVSLKQWDWEDGMCLLLDKAFFGLQEDTFVLNVYMRGSNSTRQDLDNGLDCWEILFEKISEIRGKESSIIIAGDMNAHTGEQQEILIYKDHEIENDNYLHFDFPFHFNSLYSFCESELQDLDIACFRKNEDKSINTYGRKLLELTNACGLIFLNGRLKPDKGKGSFTFFNHIGKATNDYIMCDKNILNSVLSFKVHDINIWSDHCPISCDVKCFTENSTLTKSAETYSYRWKEEEKSDFIKKLTLNSFTEDIIKINSLLDQNENKETVDQVLSHLSETLTEAGNKHKKVVKLKETNFSNRFKFKNKKWFDEECKNMRDIFFASFIKFRKTELDVDRIQMCTNRSAYNRICKLKRKEHNRAEALKMLVKSKKEPKNFWKNIKNKKGSKLPDINFFEHFKNLAENVTTLGEDGKVEIDDIEGAHGHTVIEELDKTITQLEFDSTIKQLKNNKSAGSDNILNEFITNSSNEVKSLILRIFNILLKLEYFPEIWTTGLITPVYKRGDKNDTNHYRGITILSLLSKFFTRILTNRIVSFIEERNMFTESQFGFRKSRSTTDCIFIIKGLIDLMFSQGKKLYVCFIDYTKAFDLLHRSAIFAKLLKNGISSKLINIFKSLYSRMKLGVKDDPSGQLFSSNIGCLQGEISSPGIFSLFINDLPECLSENLDGVNVVGTLIKILMFADDMALFSTTREGLQAGLNRLSKYCLKWGLTVNTEKTKIVVFRKGGKKSKDDKWTYNGKNIEVVNSFKYLGCTLSSSGYFNTNIKTNIESARKALFQLKQYFSTNPEVLPSQQLELFNTMIKPIMTYSCEVWGLQNIKELETIYLSFLKSVLCVKKSTPNCFIYGEFGVLPLIIEMKIRIVKYWLKLIRPTTTHENFARKIYIQLLLLNITEPNQKTWVSEVKDMFNSLGLGYIWNLQKVENENEFLKLFRQRLLDIYKQDWASELSNSSDGRLYKFLKTKHEFESYLNLPKHLRTAIAKIRMSSHVFFIERGRWLKIERKKRTCEQCGIIEDEFHIFLECPRF